MYLLRTAVKRGTIYGDQNHAPNGDAEVRTSGVWSLWKILPDRIRPSVIQRNSAQMWPRQTGESATVTTLDDKIIPYITNICKRDPRTGNVVTGGIVSCQDSSWLLSWTINRQGQFKEQDKDKVCVWVYGLFTDVQGDFIKKPMKDCTGKEITAEWLYHLGVPEDPDYGSGRKQCRLCADHDALYHCILYAKSKRRQTGCHPDGCVNFASLGQFAETPRDTVFTTEYSVRTAMEAVYGLLEVCRQRCTGGLGAVFMISGTVRQHRETHGWQIAIGY